MAISVDDLKAARIRAGMTQAEVAARMGTTQSAVARWERGAVTPSLDAASRYAAAVGADLTIGPIEVVFASDDDAFLAPEERASLERNLGLTPEQRVNRLTTMVRIAGRGRRSMAEARTRG